MSPTNDVNHLSPLTEVDVVGVVGVVLCGGASRRMGFDKALLTDRSGVALARRVADALLAAGASSVVCSGGNANALSALGLSVVRDREPGRGPLVGLSDTLDTLATHCDPDTIVMVAACDLPALDAAVPRQLIAALVTAPTADAAVPVLVGVRQAQLLALRLRARDSFEAAVATGRSSLQAMLDVVTVVEVEPCAPTTLDDVDEPDDLARYASTMAAPEIDIDQLAALLDGGAFLLDVRNPDEYATSHLDTAVLLPLGELAERADEVPVDAPVYVICAVGARSARAVDHLCSIGVEAVNVAGGMTAWIASGRPTAGQDR